MSRIASAPAGSNPATPTSSDSAPLQASAQFNGTAYRVANGQATSSLPPLIAVNGVNMSRADAVGDFAAPLSRLSGRDVDLVYNASSASSIAVVAGAGTAATDSLIGGLPPPVRAVLDAGMATEQARALLRNPPAAAQLATQIQNQLRNTTGRVDVVAYSQGGTIAGEALRELQSQGVSEHDLARVNVLGIGAAVRHSDFPPGVHFTEIEHASDAIPGLFGDHGSPLEAAARAATSAIPNGNPLEQHINYTGHDPRFGGQTQAVPPDPQVTAAYNAWIAGQRITATMNDRH